MRQKVEIENRVDAENRPAGGFVKGVGLDIRWQNGPLGNGESRVDPNGAFVEDVLEACAKRLRFYQEVSNGKYACRENMMAIILVEKAIVFLHERTAARVARGVEGTHQP